jgi:hypothetical protein
MLGDVGHFGELGFCASAMDQICIAAEIDLERLMKAVR